MPKTKTPKKDNGEIKLEEDYRRLFFPANDRRPVEQNTCLAQPHVLKVVRSVVTYSAYEDPV